MLITDFLVDGTVAFEVVTVGVVDMRFNPL
jgi:hypothetical protein